MSEAIDFVVAARNAGRDVMNDQARKAGAAAGHELEISPEERNVLTRHLCLAIMAVLKVLPELPIGSRASAGAALKSLALTLDISARVFSIADGSAPAARNDFQSENSERGDGPHTAANPLAAGAETPAAPIPEQGGDDMRRYWLETKQHE